MTPNAIEILVHCYVSSLPHPRFDAPAVQDALNRMEKDGLIRLVDAGLYRTTARGQAHIAQLCNLPLPEQAWVDAQGQVIDTTLSRVTCSPN